MVTLCLFGVVCVYEVVLCQSPIIFVFVFCHLISFCSCFVNNKCHIHHFPIHWNTNPICTFTVMTVKLSVSTLLQSNHILNVALVHNIIAYGCKQPLLVSLSFILKAHASVWLSLALAFVFRGSQLIWSMLCEGSVSWDSGRCVTTCFPGGRTVRGASG